MKRNALRRILMRVGICFCLGAAMLAMFNAREGKIAAQNAENTLKTLEPIMLHSVTQSQEITIIDESAAEQKRDMPEQVIDGIAYVGILRIPELGLELPVIGQWSNENARKAPCRYSGSVYQDDLILCAHNYKSHFGKLSTLREGDMLSFTDMEGNVFSYRISAFETLKGTAIEDMESVEWDLTLFTCTAGGKSRFTVRCSKSE